MSTMLDAALKYAARGWPVFQLHSIRDGRCTCLKSECSPGKHPLFTGGFHTATTDPAIIRQWWKERSWANIGIPTGRVSGFVVVDADPRHGGDDSLHDLKPLPDTVRAITGSGGTHLLFAHPGGEIRNGESLLPGIDFRGDGGYIVVPPSLHISGRRYEWEIGAGPNDLGFAPLPQKIRVLLGKSRVAVDALAEPIEGGKRNATLASVAGSLRRRGLPEDVILSTLKVVNAECCRGPLPESEVEEIAHSYGQYPQGNPADSAFPHPSSWPGRVRAAMRGQTS